MAVNEEDKDIESVAQPNTESAYLGSDPQIGDAFVRTSLDSYQVEDAANERLAKETLDLRDENEKLKVELGNLSKVVNPEDGKGKKTDKGGFSTFISSVGDALTSFTEGIDKKMETVYDDREKRTRFLQGLNTIISASSFTPIGQAKSPVGMIAEGQKKGFLESEAIGTKRKSLDVEQTKAQASLLKAMKDEPPRIRGTVDEAILKLYPDFQSRFRDKQKQYGALDQRYIELYKLAQKGFEAPTGLVSEFLTPFEKIFSELGLSEKFRSLEASVSKYEPGQDLSAADKVAFKDLFSAATKQAIVSQVKDLYPASDKDIQVLLSTVGDIGTNPKALQKLVAVQKALIEINNLIPNYAKEEAFTNKNIEFESVANEKAAVALAEQLKDKVTDQSLIELFGTKDDVNPFRIINAYYYQTLEPQFKGTTTDYFDTYKKTQAAQEKTITDIIDTEINNELINKPK